MPIEITALGPKEFEVTGLPTPHATLDAHISFEDGEWVVTEFDSAIADPDDAFVASNQYASLEAALADLLPAPVKHKES